VKRWTSRTEEETRGIGRALAEGSSRDEVWLLEGDLGAGKTVLTRGMAEGLGISGDEVQSPTYTLIREHQGVGGRLVHLDLYRLEPPQVEALGLDELFAGPGLKVVEWPERLPFVPPGARRVRVVRAADDSRVVETDDVEAQDSRERFEGEGRGDGDS
jgi:tRNA threonylcarbamoyladenosine biosynthesis protein TsaE